VADGPLAADVRGSVYAAELLPDLRYGIQRIALRPGGEVAINRVGSRSWRQLTGIALDLRGNLYVSNNAESRIEKLSPQGKLLAAWGRPGSLPGRFHQPAGIAVDARGGLYVTDSANSRIQKLPARH
jgi:DNA-binding beta-propeller fold protein YncE